MVWPTVVPNPTASDELKLIFLFSEDSNLGVVIGTSISLVKYDTASPTIPEVETPSDLRILNALSSL